MSTENDPSGSEDPLVSPLGETDAAESPAEAPSEPAGAGGGGPYSAPAEPSVRGQAPNMLPGRRERRSAPERLLVRLIATCGIVGIGVAIAAIMVSSKSQGWVVGLVVSIVSVVLAAILWSSRML